MEALALVGAAAHEHWSAIFLLIAFLTVAIHELGHLLAGWAVGFHFSSVQIGPFVLQKEYGVLRAQMSFDMMTLGHAGMYADRVSKLRRRLLIFIGGGPMANVLTILVVILAGRLTLPGPDSPVGTAAGQFAAISLLLAMLSIFPQSSNDGGLLEMLLCNPLAARRFMSTSALAAQYNQGTRARD
jgi:hypothetical protein